jgi:peptidylprolyl isomerase
MPTQREALRKKHQEQKKRQNIIIAGVAVLIVAVIAWAVIAVQADNSQTSEIPTLPAPSQADTAPQSTPVPGPTVNGKQYSSAPPMTIDPQKQYFANVKMANGGEFVIQLYPDKAPITVNSFVFLAREGFFNGTTFHRVLEGFMAQGGDPTGTGGGGPGYEFVNEKNDLAFDKPGVVAMANAGPNTNGSQFFIMFGPYGLSESDYTIFGQVISGMDVVNGITRRDPNTSPTFTGDAIESITISEK